MGHRAEKNRWHHGYVTSMSGVGTAAVYRTERPSSRKNVVKPKAELPKKGRPADAGSGRIREWKPRFPDPAVDDTEMPEDGK